MDDTPIPIEETPEIPMEPSGGVPPPPPMPNVSRGWKGITILIFIILFVAGILLSSYMRPFFSGLSSGVKTVPTPTIIAATPTPIDPFADWRTYPVTMGSRTVAGLSYKLPTDVLAPSCDGTSCVSQGTYLPGGTRFTVATRGSRAFVTDANGVSFVNKEATVSGHAATEFIGTFAGRTTGGYGFTQMHGFMVEVNPTVILEMNHFTPAGITVDWARDDTLFTQIISTISFNQVLPIATTTPVPATTSGY